MSRAVRRPLPWQKSPHPLPPLPPALPDGSPWPRISIVTPSYNQGDYLEQTLLSVAQQGYPNLEHLVIDGGSTDASPAILARWRERLAHVVSEPDRGQSHALNKGFARATGEILTWLNADDLLAPNALAAVALAFHTSGADLVAGIACLFDDDGLIERHFTCCPDGPLPLADLLDLEGGWHAGKFFYQPEVMFSRAIWERAGAAVREDLRYSMDYDLWVRFAEQGARLHAIGRPVAWFRVHAAQKTRAVDGFRGELEAYRRAYAKPAPPPAPRRARRADGALRFVFLNDHGFNYGAGIAHERLAEAVAAAGHEVRPLALFEADNADSAFRLPTPDELRRAVAAVGPDLVVLGNLHAANAEPRYAEAATAAAPTLALLHDFWWLTGRCAYPEACESYRTGCHAACPTPHEYPALAPERIADAWRAKRELVASPRGPYLLANSAWAENVAAGALAGGDGAGRVGRLQLSVPTEIFQPQDRGAARRALGLPEGRFVVLLTGNLYDRRKRVAEALEALAALALPDLTVVALGPAAADERFAVADVRRPGWVGDPAQLALYYAAADLFVAPSVDETFGQAYVEAAACGTPAIGYRRSGVAEAVRDGVTGVLLDEVSPAALAAAIERLYRDPARRAALGALGRLYVESEWSPEASYRSLFLELHRLGIAGQLGLAPKIAFPARPAPVSPVRFLDRSRTAESGVLPVGALSWRRRWRHLVRRLREALSALAPSPGRAAGNREPVYRASRRGGIDFRRPGRPSFVAAFRGLSFVEPWGRWTDGPRFEVHFKQTLPRRLRVVVAAGALGENAHLPIRVSAGDASGELRIPLDPLESVPEAAAAGRSPADAPPELPEHVLDLDTSGEEYVLSIDVPSPTSPATRWSGASSDTRRLGLALQRLRVESR